MEPAPELVTYFERLVKMWESSDVEHVLDSFARDSGSLYIGTDPLEWWEDFDVISAIRKINSQETRELGGLHAEMEHVVAWKEGSVGWIAANGVGSLGGSGSLPLRMTLVVHEDGPHWRVVQWHTSLGTRNEDVVGITFTSTVDDLLLSAQSEEPPAWGVAADGAVAIMFTDVEGSTSLMETLGEERWLNLLQWHDAIVRQQVTVFGGTVVKSEGDGFMLAFPAVGSAAACAVAIQRALDPGWSGVAVRVRVGLHMGNATAEGSDFFGRTVVMAARIASAADGAEVLASQAAQEAMEGAFRLGEPRSLTLKGLVGTHSVFPVLWR